MSEELGSIGPGLGRGVKVPNNHSSSSNLDREPLDSERVISRPVFDRGDTHSSSPDGNEVGSTRVGSHHVTEVATFGCEGGGAPPRPPRFLEKKDMGRVSDEEPKGSMKLGSEASTIPRHNTEILSWVVDAGDRRVVRHGSSLLGCRALGDQ